MPEPRIIEIRAQGSIVKATTRTPVLSAQNKNKRSGGGPRGSVDGLSDSSRKRLLETVAAIAWPNTVIFITLTYPDQYPTPKESKKNMRSLLERIRRRYAECSGIWRLELQKRGAPHFHLVLCQLPYLPKETLQTWWGQIIGHSKPFTRIEAVKDKKVLRYVCKYVAKRKEEETALACSYEGILKPPESEPPPPTGRVWGVFNRDALPAGDSRRLIQLHGQWYHDLKDIANSHWSGIDASTPDGFTLFVDDATEWLDTHLQS